MNKRITVLSAALAASAVAVAVVGGCKSDAQGNGQSSGQQTMSGGTKSLEGNPGATTGPSVGYDQSDPGHYHPQTDDTHQYHPANANEVQSNH